MNFQKLTDCQLYDYCRSSGLEARKWKNRFIAALPEVYKRRLYKKKGFCSVYEFAAKMAGVSRNVVDEALRLDEKFGEMPQIKSLIPETGISKIRVIANVAQKETDKFWAEKVKTMSRGALEVYVREIKKIPGESCDKNANLPCLVR